MEAFIIPVSIGVDDLAGVLKCRRDGLRIGVGAGLMRAERKRLRRPFHTDIEQMRMCLAVPGCQLIEGACYSCSDQVHGEFGAFVIGEICYKIQTAQIVYFFCSHIN